MHRQTVVTNPPLVDILQALKATQRTEKIVEYASVSALRYVLESTEGADLEANYYIDLIWPSILEANPAITFVPAGSAPGESYSFHYNYSNTESRFGFAIALRRYAEIISKILMRLAQGKRVPVKTFEKLGFELMCATNLAFDPVPAIQGFTTFLNCFAGITPCCNEGTSTTKRGLEIFRDSLKESQSWVEGEQIKENLLVYINVVRKRADEEDDKKLYGILGQYIEIICVAACKTSLIDYICTQLQTLANPEGGKKI